MSCYVMSCHVYVTKYVIPCHAMSCHANVGTKREGVDIVHRNIIAHLKIFIDVAGNTRKESSSKSEP